MPAQFLIPLIDPVAGQLITASLWRNEFLNIFNNLTPAGIDSYSQNDTVMQTATDPFPGDVTSRPTSLQGELQRIRYQLYLLNLSISPTAAGVNYWYNRPPTAGVLSIDGNKQAVGIGTLTPISGSQLTIFANQLSRIRFLSAAGNGGSAIDFDYNGTQTWSIYSRNLGVVPLSLLFGPNSDDPSTALFVITPSGNVGIGTVNPNSAFLLDVKGQINSNNIINANSFFIHSASGNTVSDFSTDGTLAANSDSKLPTQKAVKTYVNAFVPPAVPAANITGTISTAQIGAGQVNASKLFTDVPAAVGLKSIQSFTITCNSGNSFTVNQAITSVNTAKAVPIITSMSGIVTYSATLTTSTNLQVLTNLGGGSTACTFHITVLEFN